MGLVAAYAAATMLGSREFTWAHYFGSDWLLLIHRGNVLVQIITDSHGGWSDWRDIYYPSPEPARGLLREAVAGLDWDAPRLHETFESPLGTWWEIRLPLWVIALGAVLVALWLSIWRPRIARANQRTVNLTELSGDVVAAKRPWTRRERIVGSASLSLTLVSGALWAASLWWSVARYDGERVYGIDRCALVVRVPSETEVFWRWQQGPRWESYWRSTPEASWELPHTNDMAQSSVGEWSETIVPFWTLLGVSAAPGVVLLWRHRRRRLPGFCRKCGYNLTGNVSGICPECGTPIPLWGAAQPGRSSEAEPHPEPK